MKKQTNFRLSEVALDELTRRAKQQGMSQASVIEELLLGADPKDAGSESASSFNSPTRAAKKAARASRKTKLQESVKAALPPRADMTPLVSDIRAAIKSQQDLDADLGGPDPIRKSSAIKAQPFRGPFPKPGKRK